MYSFIADQSNPSRTRLPSPAMLLLNHLIRGITPIINRLPINSNNDDDHYEELVKRQMKHDESHDTFRNYNSSPVVVVKQENGRLWSHGTVSGKGDHNYNNRCYTIHVKKTGWLITISNKHIKTIPITAEIYLQEQQNKKYRQCGRHPKTIWKTKRIKHKPHSQWTGKQSSNWDW